MKNRLILFIFFYSIIATAQSVAINNDGTTAAASAVLDLKSTTKVFLPPRMTITERDAIVSPALGLLIWCTDCGTTGAINIYNGTMWTSITAGITAGTTAGDLQYWNGTAWVVVGEGNAGQVLTWNDSGIPTWIVVNATASAAPTIRTAAQAIGTAAVGNGKASVSFTAATNNGGSPITSYTATSNPAVGTGVLNQSGSGTITVTGLANGTSYTFTVTATNAAGTSGASSQSNAITIVAPYNPPVTSGLTRIWSSVNLDRSTYRDGTLIPKVSNAADWAAATGGVWAYYNYDDANSALGKFYNRMALGNVVHKRLAPSGWHIPTPAEWDQLGIDIGGALGNGGKLLSISEGGTNDYNFSAIEAGVYRTDVWIDLNNTAWFRTSTTTKNCG
jgi:uncharacterized protein (TIGR02145 family)